jgi:hypothetical protein
MQILLARMVMAVGTGKQKKETTKQLRAIMQGHDDFIQRCHTEGK